MYSLLKKFLFQLDPERSHTVTLNSLNYAYHLGLLRFIKPSKISISNTSVMGLTFPNIVGLAAGLDKNADYVDALSQLGFGFIEIGTVTPRPQVGNVKPRLFRLTSDEAIINRMGFNNKGVEHVKERLKHMRYKGILGVNIGKNKETLLDDALQDYLICFRALWPYASYITVNISSPNTPGLRDLQQGGLLKTLLTGLKEEQQIIFNKQKKYVPLVLKISPDLSQDAISEVADILLQLEIDGVIATNTTIDRMGVERSPYAKEAGGLSGRPLSSRSTEVIKLLYASLQNKIPIIASGGVMDEETTRAKLKAGAVLLQVYTGFIYRGPGIISDVANCV
jgi:dihydroorotate dehydrogenase